MFHIFTSQFIQLPFLWTSNVEAKEAQEPKEFTEDDDLDLCIYYLRTISNIFRWAPDAIWGILATKGLSSESYPSLSEISGFPSDIVGFPYTNCSSGYRGGGLNTVLPIASLP